MFLGFIIGVVVGANIGLVLFCLIKYGNKDKDVDKKS